jgi:hypothetical protein
MKNTTYYGRAQLNKDEIMIFIGNRRALSKVQIPTNQYF